jgi:hypothetical protein
MMSKQTLNEAELLLLKNWDEAHLLERSMERVREKYNALFEQVAEAVKQAHPELDSHKIYVTQFWGKGAVGFGRKSWPDGDTYNMPGLWLDHLRLEMLTGEDEPPPVASIWIPPKAFKKVGTDAASARQQLLAAAQQLLAKDEYERHVRADSGGKSVLYFTTLSKKEVLDLFVADEGAGLVEALVAQFDLLARFVAPLDTILKYQPATP